MNRLQGLIGALVSGGSAACCAAGGCEAQWSDHFGGGDLTGTPRAFVLFDDDGPGPHQTELMVGGSFFNAGGLQSPYLVAWDGVRWKPLGGSVSNSVSGLVNAMIVHDDDGDGPNLPALFATGGFATAGGVSAARIGKWDGQTWSALGSGLAGTGLALASFDDDGEGPNRVALYVGGQFLSAGGMTVNRLARWDGANWSAVGGGVSSGTGSTYVAALSVFDLDGPGPGAPELVVGGSFSIAGPLTAYNIARWNGSAWSNMGGVVGGDAFGHGVRTFAAFDEDGPGPGGPSLFAGGPFIQSEGLDVNRLARWNGSSWVSVGSGMNGAVLNLRVADLDGMGPLPAALYAGGAFTNAGGVTANRIARWDGSAFANLTSGMTDATDNVAAIGAFDEDGNGPAPERLFVGGFFFRAGGLDTQYIARWDDQRWSGLGNAVNDPVQSLAVFDEDGSGPGVPALFVGGSATTAGGGAVRAITRWDGQVWSDVSGGMTGGSVVTQVMALRTHDPDGDGPAEAALYAGGDFTLAGGSAANRVARWDGVAWSPLGTGANNIVRALVTHDEDADGPLPARLFAAGNFTQAGGVNADRVARWDGSAWSALGQGLNNIAYALASFDPDGSGPTAPSLIVGGVFTNAGGAPASRLARWDGSNWSPLAASVLGEVRALAVFDDDGPGSNLPALYAGGTFTSIDGVPAACIARWDGSSWTALSSGANDTVECLSVFDFDGDGGAAPSLLVGGWFTSVGGGTANRIAAWNGSAWTALDTGISGGLTTPQVHALSVFDPDADGPIPASLFAGGNFELAGGKPSMFIARFDLPTEPMILRAPETRAVPLGSTVTLHTGAEAVPEGSYLWRRNDIPLADGPGPSGSTLSGTPTHTLAIANVSEANEGFYDCVVINACGEQSTQPVELIVCAQGDANGDGVVSFVDVTTILAGFGVATSPFAAGDPNGDGIVSFADITTVLGAFGANCP